eukprot:XP_016664148.1 PREDICTED: uncharacterized protein LOC107885159 [Acyrthosiphon pisum]
MILMNFTVCRDAVVRSHQSDTVLHRVDQLQRRILVVTLRQPILLQLGPLRSAGVRVRFDGRTRDTQSSWYLLLAHEREKTLRQRLPQEDAEDVIVVIDLQPCADVCNFPQRYTQYNNKI